RESELAALVEGRDADRAQREASEASVAQLRAELAVARDRELALEGDRAGEAGEIARLQDELARGEQQAQTTTVELEAARQRLGQLERDAADAGARYEQDAPAREQLHARADELLARLADAE